MSGDDIVQRLRDCGVFTTTDENGDVQVGMRLVSPKDCNEAADEIKRLRAALRYISSPTMSLPGGADAAQHALVADARAVRLALQTCIRMAREALTNGSASATDVGGPS